MDLISNWLLIVSMCMYPPLTDNEVCREIYHKHIDEIEIQSCITEGLEWVRDYGDIT